MSNEENKALVRHYLSELWDKHHIAAIDEYVAADYTPHGGAMSSGREGLKNFFNVLHVAFPDIQISIEDMIAEDDKVVWRSTIRGTHTGMFQNVAPTGNPVAVTSINIVRVVDGKIIESWNETDNLGMMRQLGVFPQPR